MPKTENTAGVNATRVQLDGSEENALQRALNRSLVDLRSEGSHSIVSQVRNYENEIQTAAEIAKHELSGTFEGQSPSSGSFGISQIHPGFFGYDSWDDMPWLTGCDSANWLDSSTPSNLNGAGGGGFADPLGVGEPVTHIILGFGSYAADPVVSRIKWEKNEQPEVAVQTEDAFRNTDLRVKWLDTPVILQPNDDFAARVFAGGEAGSQYYDAVYPIGHSFIEARSGRILDPAQMAGQDESNIVVQQS